MAGYSGTPLGEKLGIKPGCRLFVAGAPKNYADLVAPLPEGVTFARAASESDIAHIFASAVDDVWSALKLVLRKQKRKSR